MADNTKIEWTDATWNPVRGCTRISPGCGGPGKHGGCYAEVMAARFSKPGQWGHGYAETLPNGDRRWTGKVGLVEDKLSWPMTWKGAKEPVRGPGMPSLIFANSTSDLFHERLPDEAIDHVFAEMAIAQHHTFQVLTKRSDRMRAYMTNNRVRDCSIRAGSPWPLPNVWLGVSVEDQARADERIPHLLETPAAVRFISAEPLLGPLNILQYLLTGFPDRYVGDQPEWSKPIGWLIAGGESGPNARPMHPDWARSLRDQCAAAEVPFFFKQWGEWTEELPPQGVHIKDQHPFEDGLVVNNIGKKAAGALLDGREHREFPQ